MVFFGHLHGEEAEEQEDVVSTLSQCRHLYRDSVEAVVEVLAKAAFAHSLAHVYVGGCHDADIRFPYLSSTHADVFSRFEHAQQSCLRLYREFAHLVEEDGTLVGNTEVSFAFAYGSSEGTLLMSEEFAVNGSFRNASTVDGEIFLSAAWRIVVNHPWNDFLTHTALADDEHGEIGRRYL